MKRLPLLVTLTMAATPIFAQETRQLNAHIHGAGHLDIAFEGAQIAMALQAPGADIVGFEYSPQTVEDRTTVNDAIAMLQKPLDLFVLPDAAGCTVTTANVQLEALGDTNPDAADSHDDDDDHGHDDHADGDDDHGRGDHTAGDGDDHDHDDHADGDDHDHDDHADGGNHDDHAQEAGHTEFHAEYLLTCTDPSQVTDISFAYFDTFANAAWIEVQVVTDAGATSFEVKRAEPTLDLTDAL